MKEEVSEQVILRGKAASEEETAQPDQPHKKEGEKKKPKREPSPHQKLSECNLDALFLNEEPLGNKDFKQIDDCLRYLKQASCNKIIGNYFQAKEKLEISLKKAHAVIVKSLELDPILLLAYLNTIKRNEKKMKEFCDIKEIKKLLNKIHKLDYPYFCEAFHLSVPEKKFDELIDFYAEKGNFAPGFKLIEITKSGRNKVDILVRAARKDELRDVAGHLIALGYTKEDFPQIHQDLLVSALYYHLGDSGYERVEQIFRPYPYLLAMAVGRMLGPKEKKYDEAASVCHRNPEAIKYLKFPDKMRKQIAKMKQFIPNSLQTDVFGPSDPTKYWSFSEFGLGRKDVLFLHEDHPKIEETLEQLLEADMIGIDTESLVARSKFDKDIDILATVQIANKKKVYVVDPVKIKKPNIVKLFEKFFSDPAKTVVGHTIQEDFHITLKALGIQKSACKVIELKDLYKPLFPNEKAGLARMCEMTLGKPICKEYTLTDWGRRPLLLNQLHYAAMDAFIVLVVLEKLVELGKAAQAK